MKGFRLSMLTLVGTGAALAAGFSASRGVAAEKPLVLPTLGYDLNEAPIVGADPAPAPVLAMSPDPDAAELDCLAKVVHHEALNQPRHGQLAVAHVLIARKASGRFAGSLCGVARQPGQFFDIAAYTPRRDSAGWRQAMDVAREAMVGAAETPAPGAMFFRAAYQPANSFFRSRQRVATVGDHVFYR